MAIETCISSEHILLLNTYLFEKSLDVIFVIFIKLYTFVLCSGMTPSAWKGMEKETQVTWTPQIIY